MTVSVSGATPSISVQPEEDKTTSVKVTASGVAKDTLGNNRSFTIPTTSEVVAKFTSTTAIGEVYTNDLTEFNTNSKTITFVGKDAVKYAGVSGKKYSYKNQFGNTITVEEFESTLKATAVDGNTLKVTYATSGDDVSISIISVVTGGVTLVDKIAENTSNQAAADAVKDQINALTATSTVADVLAANTAYNALTTDQKALVPNAAKTALETAIDNKITAQTTAVPAADENDYTAATWTAYGTALALPTTSLAEKAAKLTALNTANTALKSAVEVTLSGLTFTFAPAVTDATVTIDSPLAATATTDTDSSITGVTVNTTTNTITVAGTVDATDVITATVTVNGVLLSVEFTSADNGTTWVANPASPITAR